MPTTRKLQISPTFPSLPSTLSHFFTYPLATTLLNTFYIHTSASLNISNPKTCRSARLKNDCVFALICGKKRNAGSPSAPVQNGCRFAGNKQAAFKSKKQGHSWKDKNFNQHFGKKKQFSKNLEGVEIVKKLFSRRKWRFAYSEVANLANFNFYRQCLQHCVGFFWPFCRLFLDIGLLVTLGIPKRLVMTIQSPYHQG